MSVFEPALPKEGRGSLFMFLLAKEQTAGQTYNALQSGVGLSLSEPHS